MQLPMHIIPALVPLLVAGIHTPHATVSAYRRVSEDTPLFVPR